MQPFKSSLLRSHSPVSLCHTDFSRCPRWPSCSSACTALFLPLVGTRIPCNCPTCWHPPQLECNLHNCRLTHSFTCHHIPSPYRSVWHRRHGINTCYKGHPVNSCCTSLCAFSTPSLSFPQPHNNPCESVIYTSLPAFSPSHSSIPCNLASVPMCVSISMKIN